MDVASLLTPIPDQSFDVIKLLRDHSIKMKNGYPVNPRSGVLPLQHNISPKILSVDNSLEAFPESLQSRDVGTGNKWYDLAECIDDEAENLASNLYPVRFQIMHRLFASTNEGENSSNKHIILGVRDMTAELAIIVPFEKVTEYTNTMVTSDRVYDVIKHHVLYTRIRCIEKDGTKFFIMGDKLKIYTPSRLQHYSM